MTAALSMPEWILVLAVPSVVIGIFGYRWIHRVMQATAVVVGVSLVIMFVQGLQHALPASETTLARPSAGLFLGRRRPAGHRHAVVRPVRLATTPGTCPAKTNGRRLFWAIYTGNVLATIGSCAIGAYLTALLPIARHRSRPSGKISGKWALIIMALSPRQREHLQRIYRVFPGDLRSAACGAGSRPSRSPSG